jgi:hypothetical protein
VPSHFNWPLPEKDCLNNGKQAIGKQKEKMWRENVGRIGKKYRRGNNCTSF